MPSVKANLGKTLNLSRIRASRSLTFLKFSDTRSAVIAQDQQWFYSTQGERFGPVGFDYLLELSQSGKLDPRNDLVWSTSLSDWEPAGEVEGLFERRSVQSRGEDSLAGTESLSRTGEYVSPVIVPKGHQGGTGRIGYLMGTMVLPPLILVAWGFAVTFLKPYVPVPYQGYLPMVAGPLVGLLALVSQVKRFQNLGMTGWWVLGLVIPFLNLWLLYRSIACPTGYAGVKRLDGIGKVLAFLYWGGIVASIGLFGAAAAGVIKEKNDSGMLEDLMKQIKELRSSALPDR